MIFWDIQTVVPLLAFSSSSSPIQAVLVITAFGRVYGRGESRFYGNLRFGEKEVCWQSSVLKGHHISLGQ